MSDNTQGFPVQHVIPVVQAPDRVPGAAMWDIPNVVLIDNTTLGLWEPWANKNGYEYVTFHRNLGVATSWNLGVAVARKKGAEYVSLVSSSMIFPNGLSEWDRIVREDADWRGLLTTNAFHASAWSMSVFDTIGTFDENFYPAYEEDTDWLRRLELAGIHVPPERAAAVRRYETMMPKVELGIGCEDAASLKAGVSVNFERNRRYYAMKWGADKHMETYDKPFNLWVPLSWWPVLRDV